VLNSGFKHAISPYISRLYALKASCETPTRLRRIFKGVSAVGRATTALGATKAALTGLISERDPVSTGDRPLKGVAPLVKGL
jgi:hypothetical protein